MDKKDFLKWLSDELLMTVNEDTVFLKDLQLAGLDIDCFFIEFVDKFGIDASLLNVNDYTLEDTSFFEVWFKGKRVKTFKPNHLFKVIKLKKWYDPEEIDKHLS